MFKGPKMFSIFSFPRLYHHWREWKMQWTVSVGHVLFPVCAIAMPEPWTSRDDESIGRFGESDTLMPNKGMRIGGDMEFTRVKGSMLYARNLSLLLLRKRFLYLSWMLTFREVMVHCSWTVQTWWVIYILEGKDYQYIDVDFPTSF